MFFSGDPPRPFMPTPCQEMGLNRLELLIESIVQSMEALKLLSAENCLNQLLSLKLGVSTALAVTNTLINTTVTLPINRLPPEILGNIFALVPRKLRYETAGHGHCPLSETLVEDLHTLPKVCRYWRELALAMPTLWSTISTTYNDSAHYYFRHSIYLLDNPSLELNVQLDVDILDPRMKESLLRNSFRTRELHYSDTLSTQELVPFIQSFNTNAIEKCLVTSYKTDSHTLSPPFYPFFSGRGSRLRSLCLTNLSVLPANEFPVLSCLMLCLDSGVFISWSLWDLLKFVSGCPMLEEIHVCGAWFTTATSSHNPHPILTGPVSLPRLRYLSFEYVTRRDVPVDSVKFVDFLLSNIIIPSTCHLYLKVLSESGNELNCGILDSVCRHISNKNRISHVALWFPSTSLNPRDIMLQLVFSKGSLRLLFEDPRRRRRDTFDIGGLLQLLRARPDTVATTTDLRIHYGHKMSKSDMKLTRLGDALPAIFPNLKLLSIIAPGSHWANNLPGQPWLRLLRPASDQSPSAARAESIPYPALETLWVMLHELDDSEDSAVTQLREALAKRAELGFPVRRVIVAYTTTQTSDPPPQDDRAKRDLVAQQLDGIVYEVVLMGIPKHERPSEVDWMAWYPEKYELPADVHRDWPAWWRWG